MVKGGGSLSAFETRGVCCSHCDGKRVAITAAGAGSGGPDRIGTDLARSAPIDDMATVVVLASVYSTGASVAACGTAGPRYTAASAGTACGERAALVYPPDNVPAIAPAPTMARHAKKRPAFKRKPPFAISRWPGASLTIEATICP